MSILVSMCVHLFSIWSASPLCRHFRVRFCSLSRIVMLCSGSVAFDTLLRLRSDHLGVFLSMSRVLSLNRLRSRSPPTKTTTTMELNMFLNILHEKKLLQPCPANCGGGHACDQTKPTRSGDTILGKIRFKHMGHDKPAASGNILGSR